MGDYDYQFENWDYNLSEGMFSGEGDEKFEDNSPDVALIVFRLLVCTIGVIGNALVIFVVFVHREYKKAVTHWYVLQLAIADSLFLLTIPFRVVEEVHKEWIFTISMCKAKEAILFLNYYASVLFLMVMSVDRYIAVCHAFSARLQKLRTKQAANVIALIVWGVSLLLCTPMFLYADKRGEEPHCECYAEFPHHSENDICSDLGLTEGEGKRMCLDFSAEVCVNHEKMMEELGKFLNAGWDLQPGTNNTNGSSSSVPEMPHSGDETTEGLANADFYPHSFIYDGNDTLNDSSTDDWIYPNAPEATDQNAYSPGCSYAENSKYWIQFLYANFFLMFFIPFVMMSICYLLIARELKKTDVRRASVVSTTSADKNKQRKKSAATLKVERDRSRVTFICLALVVLFVSCWLPFHLSHLVKIKGMSGTTEFCLGMASWTTIVAYLNSALNPYVYNFVGQKFVKRLRSAIRTVRSTVKERTSSFSSGVGPVRFRRRKSSYAGTSSNSATIMTKLHKGRKSEGDSSQGHSSGDQQSRSRMLDSTV